MALIQVEMLLNGIRDYNGNPLSGGLVYTYTAGTTSALATYYDIAGLTQAPNPVVLDAHGMAQVYASGQYKFVIQTSTGNTLYTMDNLSYQAIQSSAWTVVPVTVTYSSGSTFTCSGDYTAYFPANIAIQLTIVSGPVTGWVISSNYAAGSTTVVTTLSTLTSYITGSEASVGPSPATLPPAETSGVIKPYVGFTAPTGYLLCDGTAYTRTTYPALFAASSLSTTGNFTSTSAVVTSIPSTSVMSPFMPISGVKIPYTASGIIGCSVGIQQTVTAANVSYGTWTNAIYGNPFVTGLTGWTDSGSKWSYSSSAAAHASGTADTLTSSVALVSGAQYTITYTVAYTSGTGVTLSAGGQTDTQRTGTGTYSFTFQASATTAIVLTPTSDFVGSVSALTIQKLTDPQSYSANVVAAWGSGTQTGTLTISGLTVNQNYVLQFTMGTITGQAPTLTATSGATVSITIPSMTSAAKINIPFAATAISAVFTFTNTGASSWSTTGTMAVTAPLCTYILSVDSGTQITMSQPASASGSGAALVVAPWGVGDGSTTFNVPDLRGRTILGAGTGTGLTARALGVSSGAEANGVTLLSGNIPAFTPSFATGGNLGVGTTNAAAVRVDTGTTYYVVQSVASPYSLSSATFNSNGGSSAPLNVATMQPGAPVNFIVKI